jgi:hypothetical protein
MTERAYTAVLRACLRALGGAPTVREMLVFGVVVLACLWVLNGQRPRENVFVVPDELVSMGVGT